MILSSRAGTAGKAAVCCAAMLTLGLAVGRSADAQSFTNAGFESPQQTGSGYSYYGGSTQGGYDFTGGSGLSGANTAFTSGMTSQTGQVAFLQNTAGVSQTVSGFKAGTYTLTFDVAQRQDYGSSPQTVTVKMDGQTILSDYYTKSTAYGAITTASFTATAGSSHTFLITGTNARGYSDTTAFVDNLALNYRSNGEPVIANSGFEAPNVKSDMFGAFQYAPTGYGWDFAGGSGVTGDYSGFTTGNPTAPEQLQAAFLQGGSGSSISQSIHFDKNGYYVFSFDAAQRAAGDGKSGPDHQNFQVYVDGKLLGTYTPGSTNYSLFKSGTALSAGNHTLKFVGLDTAGGDNSALIDDVQATAVPEPSSVAAFALTGLFAAGLMLRARRGRAQLSV